MVRLTDEANKSVLHVDIPIEKIPGHLGHLVRKEAVCRIIVPYSLSELIHRHHADIAGLNIPERALSREQIDVGIDLADRHGEININVLRSVAVCNITGMNNAGVIVIRVPADVQSLARRRQSSGMQIYVDSVFVVPIDEESDIFCTLRNPVRDTAANITAILGAVFRLQDRMRQVILRQVAEDFLAFQRCASPSKMLL